MTEQQELLEIPTEAAQVEEEARALFKDAVCWCEHPDRTHNDGGPCSVCSCQGFNFNGWCRKRPKRKRV